MKMINCRRALGATLSHYAKSIGKADQVTALLAKLQELVKIIGQESRNERVLFALGTALLADQKTVIVPVCPDYSHNGWRYTFEGLNGGVSLVTQKHLEFLLAVKEIFPDLQVIFLMADHEADDEAICCKVGKTRDEFQRLVLQSAEATRCLMAPLGWQSHLMTELIPDLVVQEAKIAAELTGDEALSQGLRQDAVSREDLSRLIYHAFTREEVFTRTVRTAAQYKAMGQFVAGRNYLVCNHTTVNLRWYVETDAALLHNPVRIY